MNHILVVDDNPEIREILHILLSGEGYCIEEASNGMLALDKLHTQDFDLIILDIMMPGLNGYQTCLEIRKTSNAPILFLSAKTKDGDKTLGFSSGGDDYLAKPFSYNELISRAKALIRRYQVYKGKETIMPPVSSVLHYGDLQVDESNHSVLLHGQPVILTDTEYAVLVLLVKNRGKVYSAQQLYQTIWQEPYYNGANNTVMVHIRNLRKKIEPDPKNPSVIKTVWGRGYCCD
jgi:DNA-binding response OmpR family regulator